MGKIQQNISKTLMKFKPRYYQKKCFETFLHYIANNHGKNPVVVLPTGSGKTNWQAMVIEEVLAYAGTRLLLLSHQQELLKQNATEIYNYSEGNVDIGVYSAGLGCRDYKNRVIVAGIQSVYKKAWTHIGFRDIIIIDEVHLVGSKDVGMYRFFLKEMKNINPKIIIAGMTATCFRTKTGIITEGKDKLFDEIIHETTVKELIESTHYKNLDNKQYLCNLISKSGINKADLSGVHIRGGEYVAGEMEQAFLKNNLVSRAVTEIKKYTANRNKVLVFCAGIQHCETVCEEMNGQGLSTRYIHSKQDEKINQQNLQDFKNGKFQYLCNIQILSTGFNEKAIDCIVLMMSTKSPGKYVQICGRGFRMHPDKKDCLVLDMGKNVETHGPVDCIEIRKKKDGTSEIKTAPMKECPKCLHLLFLSVMVCPDCGHEFPQKDKHEDKASSANILSEWIQPVEIEVARVVYARHKKKNKPDSLRIDYYYNMYEKYSEWCCIEHTGYARSKATQWLSNVTDMNIDTVSDALEHCENFKKPTKIIVDINGKFANITGYIFEQKKAETIPDEKKLERLIF